MRTLGLVPARGGSKGIPRKNVKPIAGKPLIAWTIEAGLAAQCLDAVVVSTDDDEIAGAARDHGAAVPFMRPAELARDDTSGIDPILHAIDTLPEFDAVMLLQPTSPLRTADDIDRCVELAMRHDGSPTVSVTVPECRPEWMFRFGDDERLEPFAAHPAPATRQALSPLYMLNGALYFARTDRLRRQRTFIGSDTVGYVMPLERSVDIDNPLDWKLAELLLTERS